MTKQLLQIKEFTVKSTICTIVSACLGSGLLLTTMRLPAQAQATRPAPLEDLQTKDGSDFFNGRSNSSTGSVMNFIQNAIIGTPRSSEEFASEQRESFDEATLKFRQQQAERLRKQQTQPSPDSQVAPLPVKPTTTP